MSRSLAPLFLMACTSMSLGCGEAIYRYRGTISSAPEPGHTTDRSPNPKKLRPVAGARVYVHVGPPSVGAWDRPRGTACPDLLGIPTDRHVADSAVTDGAGEFAVSAVAPPEWYGSRVVTLCFAAEGHMTYHFTQSTEGPCGGRGQGEECFVNVALKPSR